MTAAQTKHFYHLCENIEAQISNLKEELLMVMLIEQSRLLETKYDRKDYHNHVTKNRT